jgi:hypothetical protein
MKCIGSAVLIVAVLGCSGESYYTTTEADGFVSSDPTVFQRGDTIKAIATEFVQHPYAGSDPTARSDANPERFSWSVEDTAVATVDADGRVFMKASGQTWVKAKTSRSSSRFRIFVVGPFDDIELTPHELTMTLGSAAPYTLRFVDSTRTPYDWPTENLPGAFHRSTDPEHAANSHSGLTWHYFPSVAGDITVEVTVAVRHGHPPLRDTVIVRAR